MLLLHRAAAPAAAAAAAAATVPAAPPAAPPGPLAPHGLLSILRSDWRRLHDHRDLWDLADRLSCVGEVQPKLVNSALLARTMNIMCYLCFERTKDIESKVT